MALRCSLIRTEDRCILIDNGMGEQWDARQRSQLR